MHDIHAKGIKNAQWHLKFIFDEYSISFDLCRDNTDLLQRFIFQKDQMKTNFK